jgi:hypothetical protein
VDEILGAQADQVRRGVATKKIAICEVVGRRAVISEGTEVTTVVSRHIKPGHEKEYAEWLQRILDTMKKFPGYRGVTIVVPGGSDPDARIVLYRFADRTTMENWEGSPERKKLLSEVQDYATQMYTKASRMETWFELPNTHSVVPPPK